MSKNTVRETTQTSAVTIESLNKREAELRVERGKALAQVNAIEGALALIAELKAALATNSDAQKEQ